jgi:GNAT superfamily N-acetyltransferase
MYHHCLFSTYKLINATTLGISAKVWVVLEATIALTRPVDTFLYTDITDPLGEPLFDELSYEYATRYGATHSLKSPENTESKKYPPILFTPPGGAFLLLLRDGEPIAGGAFMQIDKRTVEMKRIWTATDYRRQGLSTRVLHELEAEAARRGFSRIYLTTGNRQPEARNLYLKTGYTPLFDVEADPAELGLLAFEKAIEPVIDPNAPKPGIRDRIHAWRQQRYIARAWTMRNPIPRRLDDAAF